jgi:hypothetical protein
MEPIDLGRTDATIADVLNFIERDLASLGGVHSPSLAFEIQITVQTSTGDEYPLAIKIERSGDAMPYRFKTSHYAKTPDQIYQYVTSNPYERTIGSAIHRAIASVKSYVDQAIANGHTYDQAWLVSNPRF